MDEDAAIILGDTIACCQRDGQDQRIINMLGQSRALQLTEDTLTIEAPSRFAIAQIMRHKETIERYLEEIAFAPIALEVVAPRGVAPSPVPAATPGAPAMPAQAVAAQAVAAPAMEPASAVSAGPAPHAATAVAAAQAPATAPTTDVSRETMAGTSQMTMPGAAAVANPATAAPETSAYMPTAPVAAAAVPATSATAPTAFEATTGEATGVTVKNTLSADDFRRMMDRMKGNEAPRRQHAAAAPVPATAEAAPAAVDDAPLAANSKFTFENFVYGPENQLAYHSAFKFALAADEPGICTSLFIYGKSGLGKTHLLLAIKNEIAEKAPQVKVKYANSQTYIDDYMGELANQKDRAGRIMASYHGADVLIIDDIQNIIGKQASIQYFFQLIDEFIRAGKKVVIASDRAPKDLEMDERITSRFNAGMLCLVSEPGFEMKLAILRRYYETTIAGATDMPGDSLLASLNADSGKLTDEQLSHMAEVSGNNVRELESFCERCAGAAGDAERMGGELTFDDIDEIAGQYFATAPKKITVGTVQSVIEEQFGVTHEELIGPRRNANIAKARHIAIYLAIEMCEMTTTAVGAEFGGRNHSTVSTSYKKVQKMILEDRGFTEDLKALRNKITLRS